MKKSIKLLQQCLVANPYLKKAFQRIFDKQNLFIDLYMQQSISNRQFNKKNSCQIAIFAAKYHNIFKLNLYLSKYIAFSQIVSWVPLVILNQG